MDDYFSVGEKSRTVNNISVVHFHIDVVAGFVY